MEQIAQDLKDKADRYVLIAQYIKPHVDEAYGVVIMQQIGKDFRCEQLIANGHANGNSKNGNSPATSRQLSYLKNLGVTFDNGITKQQASTLIEEAKIVGNLVNNVSRK